jgi:hypothetical protein
MMGMGVGGGFAMLMLVSWTVVVASATPAARPARPRALTATAGR